MNYIYALITMIGTIIGGGIFAIPFVIMKSGFPVGCIWMLISVGLILLTKLYLGEVIQRTKGDYHLPGYAGKYLGKTGKLIMFGALVFGVMSSLISYLIGMGDSFSTLFHSNKNYSIIYSYLSWVVMSIITLFGVRLLKITEVIGTLPIFIIVILIVILFSSMFNLKE